MNYHYTEVDFERPSLLFRFEDMLKGYLGFLFYNPFLSLFNLKGNENVLDFGSGGGAGTRCILDKLNPGGSVTCIDSSAYWMNRARKRLKKYRNVRFAQGDIRSLDIPDLSFDVISIIHVIHDIPPVERESIIQSLGKKLKTSGALFVCEPTRESHGMAVEEIRTHMDKADLREVRFINKKSSFIGQYERKNSD